MNKQFKLAFTGLAFAIVTQYGCKKSNLPDQQSVETKPMLKTAGANNSTDGISTNAQLISLMEDSTVKTVWLQPGITFTISEVINVACNTGDKIKQLSLAAESSGATGNAIVISDPSLPLFKLQGGITGLRVLGNGDAKRIVLKGPGITTDSIGTYTNELISISHNLTPSFNNLTIKYVDFRNAKYCINYQFYSNNLNGSKVDVQNCNFNNYCWRGIMMNRKIGKYATFHLNLVNNTFTNNRDYTPDQSYKVKSFALDCGNNTDSDEKRIHIDDSSSVSGNTFTNAAFGNALVTGTNISGNTFIGNTNVSWNTNFQLLHLEHTDSALVVNNNTFTITNSKVIGINLESYTDHKGFTNNTGERNISITNNHFESSTKAAFLIGGYDVGNGTKTSLSDTFSLTDGVLIQNNIFPLSTAYTGTYYAKFTRWNEAGSSDPWANRFIKFNGNTQLPVGKVTVRCHVNDNTIVGQWGADTTFKSIIP